MNTRHCEYLVAIAEQGSLSAAAKSLGLSQPTLSSFLANVEKELGHTLFTRGKRAMEATEAGAVYIRACARILEVKQRTYRAIHSLESGYSESFTVGVTPHRGSTLFSRIFHRFYRRYPNVQVKLEEGYVGALLQGLENGSIDLALGAAAPQHRLQYGFVPHGHEDLYLSVPTYHPLAKLANPPGRAPASISVRQFADTPFVLWGDQTSIGLVTAGHFAEQDIKPTAVFTSNNVLLIDSMLANGLGVGFLPQAYCVPTPGRVYFTTTPPLRYSKGTFYRMGHSLTEAQRYFIQLFIRDEIVGAPTPPVLEPEALDIYNEFKGAG